MTTELEEKDFSWLCAALCASPTPLPFLETIFLQKDEVTLWVCPGPNGSLQRRNFQEENVCFLEDALNMLKAKRDRENPGATTVCVANVKGMRMVVDDQKAGEIAANYSALGRCGYLQAPIDRLDFSSVFLLRLDSQEDDQFSSSFFIRRKTLQPAHDSRLFYKLSVYSKILIGALEVGKRKKVASIELEFTVNDREEIWLSGCGVCKLVTTHVTRSANPSPKPNKGTNSELPKTKRELKPLSAVRVSTPAQLQGKEDSLASVDAAKLPIVPSDSTFADKVAIVTPAVSALLSTGKSARSPSLRGPFYNPNFKELIARAYAKARKRLPLDIDELFQDMDASYLKEDEASARMRHCGSILIRKEEAPLFEINGDGGLRRSEDRTRATTPLVFHPSTAKSAALKDPPASSSSRPILKRVRSSAKSMGISSVQKIIEKYEEEKRIDLLTAKYAGRARSQPRLEKPKTYYFTKVSV